MPLCVVVGELPSCHGQHIALKSEILVRQARLWIQFVQYRKKKWCNVVHMVLNKRVNHELQYAQKDKPMDRLLDAGAALVS